MAAYTGKVVIVTGASSGIGKALCLALAEQWPRLVLAARDAVALQAVATACAARGADTLVVPTDVTSEEACRTLVERAVARWKAIDVLVNNAGTRHVVARRRARRPSVLRAAHARELPRLRLCTYHALPHLQRARADGSWRCQPTGTRACRLRSGYAASKHGCSASSTRCASSCAARRLGDDDRSRLRPLRDPPARAGSRRQAHGHESSPRVEDHDGRGVRGPDPGGHGGTETAADYLGSGPLGGT